MRLGGCTPVVNLSVNTNAGSEAGKTAVTVTATVSEPVVGNQTVSLGVSGTNITAGDYALSNSTITILNGAPTGSVTFTVVDDAVYEGAETATLTISTPSSGIALGATTTQNVTITDNDSVPGFSIDDVTHNEGNAGTTAYTFTVIRTGSTALNASVNFTTVNGSATTADNDYQANTGTLTFLPTDTTKTITVLVNGDTTLEANEAFTVHLSGASGATISDADGTGTITNDDSAPTFAIDDVTHNEGNAGTTSYTFTVTKTGSTALSSSVNFATVDGTATLANNDYQANSGTLNFLPTDTTKTITVLVNGDTTLEANEAFTVHLSGASGATISDADGTGTITNDDSAPTFAIDDVTHNEGNAGTTSYTFTVTRTGSTALNSSVNFTTVDGTATLANNDYQAQSGTLNFLPTDTTKTITVLVNGDTTLEANEAFTVHLSGASGATISDADGTGTITNDDTNVTVAVSPSSVAEDGTTNLVYTFTRNGVTNGALTVNFSVGGTAAFGTDYTQTGAATFGATGTVTFGSGNSAATVTVDPTPDLALEPDETVILTVAPDAGYNVVGPSVATGTITNDDAAGGIIKFSAANYNTTEDSHSVTITVERVGDTSAAVSVNYATPDDSDATTVVPCATINGLASARCDFTTAMGTLRFAVGETSKTFNVLISQDSHAEGTETLTLALSNLTSGGVFGVPTTATLTIADDATEPATNPIDDVGIFVRQHYLDFLNREPDASGFSFWTGVIENCTPKPQCTEVTRINVSASFFLSIEFQQSGYLVERLYKASYGDAMGTSNFGPTHQLAVPIVKFSEFLPDTQQIGKGVIVNNPGWEQLLETNKQNLVAEFVQRERFTTAFPTTMAPADFVNTLNANAGNPLSGAELATLIAEHAAGNKTRAQVLRKVAEHPNLLNAEFNRAFVLMQYFGYLRRNPDAAQDTDHSGYDFWLTKLDSFNGNYIQAEMVKAFITSIEYRQRFGP